MTGLWRTRYIAHVTQSDLLAHMRANPFLLAPMAGITDRPFRSLMRELGCGVVVSELVSATGLKFSSQKTYKLMEFDSTQHPVGIQLFGENLDHLRDAAQIVEQLGADFVDLNFGCPVPKVVNKGAGSACLKDLQRLREVVRATKSGISSPLTIKVRTGWDHASRNTAEVCQIAADEGVTWVAIHGRTRAAAYTGLADWEYIRTVSKSSPVPVIGNGDIVNAEVARSRLTESGCAGVMIGRGCLKNPRLFLEARGQDAEASGWDAIRVLRRLVEHLDNFYDEKLTLLQLRKFAAWYSAGLPGAAQFRRDMFGLSERTSLWARIEDYYGGVAHLQPEDTSREAFLMGGHG